MNPGGRPRRAIVAVLAMLAVGAAVVAIPAIVETDSAAADELEPFSSCEELSTWGRTAASSTTTALVSPEGGEEAASADDARAETLDQSTSATGETNVVVEGVDELDTVDRIDDHRALVIAGGTLALVDISSAQRVATTAVPQEARLTYDPDASVAWAVGANAAGTGTQVTRIDVGEATLTASGTWETSGWLVDARRTGDRLHVVAAESFGAAVPFEEGPVPCEEVLHPAGPSSPEATLLVTLPATGDVVPTHSAEVVGAGQLVHVTSSAAYLATPLWEGETQQTSIHRFDLETLAPTGSGRVEGALLNAFSMSEHEATLRVAVSHGGGFGVPTGDVAVDVAVAEPAQAPTQEAPEALNEIVVLDTDGDLDVLGRTARFGHPGETLHGIRFVGPLAYAVTFLNTDPFYVVDLADSASPRVVGEVELPGFSAYLHPIADGLVVGFGPDAEGRAAMKLFDVSDPTRPQVVDEELLGEESPIVWDHHAFVGLGEGRFAVPANSYRPVAQPACTPDALAALETEIAAVEQQLSTMSEDAPAAEPQYNRLDSLYSDPCLSPPMAADTTVIVASALSGALQVESRLTVTTDEPGTRLLQAGEGWAVLAGPRLLIADSAGTVLHDLTISE